MSNIVLNTLKRTLENVKATTIGLNRELQDAKKLVQEKQLQVEESYKNAQEIEAVIKQLETPSASKNKKTK
jgi:ABC-type transporter Mla subunit MlaD